MELILKGKLENLFKAKDFINKDTGEAKLGKYQAQFIEQVEGEEGSQLVIHKISLTDEKAMQLKNKIGEVVQISVKAYSNKGHIGFYGV